VVELVQKDEVPIFARGEKVEFLKDSPGKLSAKLFSFKTVRYITGTALVGTSQRSAIGWERAANKAVEADWAGSMEDMVQLWRGLGALPGINEVITGSVTPAKLRERNLLTSAGVQYALADAVHRAHEDGISYADATKALKAINFERPRLDGAPEPSDADPITTKESIFAGTLIDPVTGKVGSGRPAWEAAGEAVHDFIRASVRSAAA
jgi:hypothetical protein